MRNHFRPLVLLLTLGAGVLFACALGSPTVQPGLVETMVALTLQASAPLASATAAASPIPPTETPALSTATLIPLPSNTSAPASSGGNLPSGAVRVNFATGATAGIEQGQLRAGQVQNFLVGAAAGQPLIVSVDSLNHDVTFSVTGVKNGSVLLGAAQKLTSWQTMLTVTQDYLITIYAGATTENFTLNVITPARITFDSGAIAAQRSGSTPGGLIVSYVIRANAGQKMKLELVVPGGNAVLSVYGYQDGQPYLRYVVEQTSFDFTLPATQDYIIQVYPRAGEVANYTLNVEVK